MNQVSYLYVVTSSSVLILQLLIRPSDTMTRNYLKDNLRICVKPYSNLIHVFSVGNSCTLNLTFQENLYLVIKYNEE